MRLEKQPGSNSGQRSEWVIRREKTTLNLSMRKNKFELNKKNQLMDGFRPFRVAASSASLRLVFDTTKFGRSVLIDSVQAPRSRRL